MPRPERGSTPAGFRAQLLARLRNAAREQQVTARRLQQRVAFERFLARLSESDEWVLKGGFALELRYGWRARPTRDVDLRTELPTREALDQIRFRITHAAADDHFTFELSEAVQEMRLVMPWPRASGTRCS